MAHKILRYDESGSLLDGVFFELVIPLDLPDLPVEYVPDEQPPGTVVSCRGPEDPAKTFAYGTVHFDHRPTFGCQIGAGHETCSETLLSCPLGSCGRREGHWMELFGGPDVSKFVCDLSGLTVVVNAEFRDEILRSTCTGFSMAALPVPEGFNQSPITPELFFFDYLGTRCFRQPRVAAPTPNECPFCGWGPIVCPACQHLEWECPRCKNRLIVPETDHEGPDDRRFTVPGRPERGRIVEGDRWDGSDAFAGVNQGFVTGRFVELALSCGAKPFVAIPCLVDVSRCDSEQVAKVEAARFLRWRKPKRGRG